MSWSYLLINDLLLQKSKTYSLYSRGSLVRRMAPQSGSRCKDYFLVWKL